VNVAAAPLFDPLTAITWHSAVFAEDSDWVAPADGAAVSQWDDGSGNGRHYLQATGANQPLYRATVAGLNNKPAVQSQDSSDLLVQGSYTAIAQPFSVVFVAQLGAASSWVCDGIGASNRVLFNRTTGWFMDAGTARQYGTSNGNAHLFEWIVNGASSKLFVDGTQVGSTESHGANTPVGFTLFNRYTGGTSVGSASVAFFGVVASDWAVHAERANLKAWAALHYNLTIA